jgi:hypothetical protein
VSVEGPARAAPIRDLVFGATAVPRARVVVVLNVDGTVYKRTSFFFFFVPIFFFFHFLTKNAWARSINAKIETFRMGDMK